MDTTEYTKIKIALHLQRKFICVDDNPLGEGAFGQVVKAMCSKTGEHQGKMFAIKIMAYNGDKKTVRYQDREIEALIRLGPPEDSNVIKYFDSWVMIVGHEQKLCIQMELCADNLLTFVHRNPMVLTHDSPRFYRQVFAQILNGVDAIHSIGWIHRDIHLGNILVVNPNPQRISDIHVKLADFGLARYIGMEFYASVGLTVVPTLESLSPDIGNALFRAPELSTEYYDFKVDLYSAGIVLYLLARYLPNRNDIRQEILELRDEQRSPAYLYHQDDQRLCNLIEWLLQKDPNRRASAAQALAYTQTQNPRVESRIQSTTKKFLVRRHDDHILYRCSSNSDTLSSIKTAIQGHHYIGIGEDAQILHQEKIMENQTRLLGITTDQDSREMFQSADENNLKPILVVSERKTDSVAKKL